MTSSEMGTHLRPRPDPDVEAEYNVDLGRYWRAIAWRWWLIVAGIVIGGLVGFAATTGSPPYRTDVVVYLGQPLYPNGGQPIQTVSTNFQFVDQLITSERIVRQAAAKAGVKPKDLRSAIAIAAFTPEGPASPGTAARIVTISVKDLTPTQETTAASELARIVVKQTADYAGVKYSVYQARLARTNRELNLVAQREAAASKGEDEVISDQSITGAEKFLLLAHYDNVINTNEARRQTLESTQLSLREQMALSQQVELPRILEPAATVREPAPGRRSHVAVGAVIGAVIGVLAALLWEPIARLVGRRRRTAA